MYEKSREKIEFLTTFLLVEPRGIEPLGKWRKDGVNTDAFIYRCQRRFQFGAFSFLLLKNNCKNHENVWQYLFGQGGYKFCAWWTHHPNRRFQRLSFPGFGDGMPMTRSYAASREYQLR